MKKNKPDETPAENVNTKLSKKSYFEFQIPHVSLNTFSLNPYFVVVVFMILSFLLGMLTNKILFLQNAVQTGNLNNGKIGAANIAGANNIADYPTPVPKVDVKSGHLPFVGDENAKVTIVEFMDIQCPFCKQYIDNTFSELNDKYIKTGKVKLAFRHYPLNSIHPNAQKAGEATECANEQNKFWEYHDLIFKNQSLWSPQSIADAASSFTDYAGEIGMNTTQFRDCLDSDKFKKQVDDDQADGVTAGVDGTPAFFINGWRLTGAQPFSEFEKLIEQELKK